MSKKPKAKNSDKILEDQDGTFFCTKCGQAGFETKSKGYGHIAHCRGHKAVLKQARKETYEMDQAIKNIEPKQFDGPKNSSVGDSPTLNPYQESLRKLWEIHYANIAKKGGTSPLKTPSLPPSLTPLPHPPLQGGGETAKLHSLNAK